MIENSLVYEETRLLIANDDSSEGWIRSAKRNVLAMSQVERIVACDMRGSVRAASEAALGSSGADDITAVVVSELDNQSRFRQVKLGSCKPVDWGCTCQALPDGEANFTVNHQDNIGSDSRLLQRL